MTHTTRAREPLPDVADLVIVGGGIPGAGRARDAAGRGLSVVLCEKDDLASATSSASSKLVHGGLRYLATGHADVAWESAVERGQGRAVCTGACRRRSGSRVPGSPTTTNAAQSPGLASP